MRISDWSSDVCSSDLLPRCAQGDGLSGHTHSWRDRTAPELALLQERHHDLDHSAERWRRGSRATLGEVHRYFEWILILGRSPGWPNPISNSMPRLRSSRPSHIGRAWCRDGVGQYVKDSGDAGVLQ